MSKRKKAKVASAPAPASGASNGQLERCHHCGSPCLDATKYIGVTYGYSYCHEDCAREYQDHEDDQEHEDDCDERTAE